MSEKKKTLEATVEATVEATSSEDLFEASPVTANASAERDEPAVEAAAAPRRRRATRTIKSLTGSLEAQTDESRSRAAWDELLASLRRKIMLKGTVSGLEVWNKMPCAVVLFKGVKVLIPAKEFLLALPTGEDLDEKSPTYLRRTYSYMENRLGSEIEFIIVGFVDKADQIVAGSRCQAMKIRQREYFMRKARNNDDYLLNEGSRVEVRVASAMRFGLVVEFGGVDVLVPTNEVSWSRKNDISADFYTGQKLVAVITKLERTDSDIDVEVSIKRARTDPFEKARKLLQTDRNSKYLGQVTMVERNTVYVQLEDEIEVLCAPPRDGKNVVVGSRVAITVQEINEERRSVRGRIVWNGGVHSV